MFRTAQENHYQTKGYSGKRMSPAAVSGAIVVHALAITAVIMTPAQRFHFIRETVLPTTNISIPDPAPLPPTPPRKKVEKTIPTQTEADGVKITTVDPIFKAEDFQGWKPDLGGTAEQERPRIVEPHVPVFITANFDPPYMRDVQPPYPGSMVRQEMEGKVTVRVHITPEGTVDRIERISATTNEFWIATQKQALSRWRFRPATLDGVAVESERVMTVFFRLT